MKKILIAVCTVLLLSSCSNSEGKTLSDTFQTESTMEKAKPAKTMSQHETETTTTATFPETEETVINYQTNNEEILLNTDYDESVPKYNMLYPVYIDGHYEYIDKSGNLVTDGKFDNAFLFSDGMAIVKRNNLYGAIDLTGQLYINYQLREIGNFNCGLAYIVNEQGHYGYIDKMGNIKIDCIYNMAYNFSNGVAKIDYDNYTNGKYIDTDGNTIIEFTSLSPSEICNDNLIQIGWAYYNVKTGEWVEGEYLETPADGSVLPLLPYDFSDGLAVHPTTNDYHNTKWMYIDTQGKMTFNNIFDDTGSFNEGLAVVKQGGKTGVIDKTGNFVYYNDNIIPDDIYSEGCIIFRKGTYPDTRYGFLDKQGEVVIPPVYYCFFNDGFKNGLALVSENDECTKLSYIDKNNNKIFTFEKSENKHVFDNFN